MPGLAAAREAVPEGPPRMRRRRGGRERIDLTGDVLKRGLKESGLSTFPAFGHEVGRIDEDVRSAG